MSESVPGPGPRPSYLFFDTETNDLPDYDKPADEVSQPRLASFAMILTDPDLVIQHRASALIKPDGWEMKPGAQAVNGLTMERLQADGVPVGTVLLAYAVAIMEGRVVVAYNARHDTKVMRGELRRAGMDDLFERTWNVCAMRCCMGEDRQGRKKVVEKASGKRGWPKLSDACAHFRIPTPNEHTALGDAEACLDLFWELRKVGWDTEPAIHYAIVQS